MILSIAKSNPSSQQLHGISCEYELFETFINRVQFPLFSEERKTSVSHFSDKEFVSVLKTLLTREGGKGGGGAGRGGDRDRGRGRVQSSEMHLVF